MLQEWGSADFVFNIGCVLQVWGSADFVFSRGYVCHRCGDWQIWCLIRAMCVTGMGIGRFCV